MGGKLSKRNSSSLVPATNTTGVTNIYSDDLNSRLKGAFLQELCKRPSCGLTEVRRDGKDNAAIAKVITEEANRCSESMDQMEFVYHMRTYATACWATMEQLHQQFLEDETPENERARLDPDHWYENNLCNASLFANLAPEKIEGMEELVPGRLFTTRMPRDLIEDPGERKDWLDKVKKNDLKVICVLTEPHEFEKYSGTDALLEFYEKDCNLTVYNRSIPDFEIPTSGDLVNNILDLTYHLSNGENALIHCAGGTGRTGMVLAAVIQNLGVYDPVARVRKVKSTYVETIEQEKFLKNMPKAIDSRIVHEKPMLACAIAAEHLIQVFHTHKSTVEKSSCKKEALNELGDAVESLEDNDEEKLKEAYGQVFDLLDEDKSGVLDRSELRNWFEMCGAEIDVSKITETMLGDGKLTRVKFIKMMKAMAASHRREYDISGSVSGGHS